MAPPVAPLSAADRALVVAACAALRAAAFPITIHTPSTVWAAALATFAAALQAVPSTDCLNVQSLICSFDSAVTKESYYNSLPGAPAARPFAEEADNVSRRVTAMAMRSAGAAPAVHWNCFLTCSAMGNFAQGNAWHAALAVRESNAAGPTNNISAWTIYSSDSGVPAGTATVRHRFLNGHTVAVNLVLERQPTATAQGGLEISGFGPPGLQGLLCVRHALEQLANLVENIFIHRHPDPRHSGALAGRQLVTVTN